MRPLPSARMNVVRKEDKEARLKEFILKDILARKATAQHGRYFLVALSAESPVARALAALSDELAGAGIHLDAVLARVDAAPPAEALDALERVASFRRATDARLLDAHEQLVLGPDTVWIGDCMRRDPGKRDAYECYAEACRVTSVWAMRSFDRIWSAALPVPPAQTLRLADPPVTLGVMDSIAAAQGEQGPVTASTRH